MTKSQITLYGYTRVSRVQQDLQGQIDSLIYQGVPLENIFTDKISGSKRERPGLDKLLETIQPGDRVVCTALDRLSRSLQDGLEIINTINGKEVELLILGLGLISNSPEGQLIRNIFLSIAEFDRQSIRRRLEAGLERSRENNPDYIPGRPEKRPQVTDHILSMKEEGKTTKEISLIVGLSESTVKRRLRKNRDEGVE